MNAIGHASGVDTDRLSLDRVIEIAAAIGVVLLVIIGFVTSYETLRTLAVTDGGFPTWLAPAVPLSFDLGIVVLSLKVVAAARQGRQALGLRTLVAALSVSTVAVNSTASTGPAGRLLHAVPPAMFVVCFESLASTARVAGNRAPGRAVGMRSAWLLAPIATLRQRRDAILSGDRVVSAERSHGPRPRAVGAAGMSSRLAHSNPDEPVTSRLECVRQALAESPSMTAPALKQHLLAQGFQVSIRTAQRLKAQVASCSPPP